MNLEFREGDVVVKACFGERSILAHESLVEAFKARVDATPNLVTSLRRFITWTGVAGELPVVFLMHRSGELYGVALFCFRRKRGIPTGIVTAGDDTGQGGVIAMGVDRVEVLETASRVLVRLPLVHTVLLSTLWSDASFSSQRRVFAGTSACWQFREVGFRLDLSGGRDGVMDRLGYKMRRNLGYYRRRAEARFGCEFVPDLRPEQRLAAVEALCDKGTYKVSKKKSRRLEATLLAVPGSFAVGLRNGSGEWLSYIAGWRGRDGTYIDWQLNQDNLTNSSFSTVLRSYLLDQELERRSPAIVFPGGTVPHWSRACATVTCGELLIVRPGLIGNVVRGLSRRFNPSGKVARLLQGSVPFISDGRSLSCVDGDD